MTDDLLLARLLKEYSLDDADVLKELKGGNSSVLQIQAVSGEHFALKVYRGEYTRRKRNLEHELEAHSVLSSSGTIPIPQLVGSSNTIPSILYRWIDGKEPQNLDYARTFLADSFVVLRNLFRQSPSKKLAVDSVTSTLDIITQINRRHETIQNISGLPKDIVKLIEDMRQKILSNLPRNLDFPLSTLSFSDHGIHNLIQANSGTFYFIDFEFFGNDSISKLICDLHLHPQGIFSSDSLKQLHQTLSDGGDLESSYGVLLPSLALKWLYIVLRRNIDWDSRTFIGDSEIRENLDRYLQYIRYVINGSHFGLPMTHYDFVQTN